MQTLNLPTTDCKITKQGDKYLIFDRIRKKFVVLTPEEWVRQQFIGYLVEHQHYPPGLISVETGLHYHKRKKRSDIQVFDRSGGIFMLVECKSPEIKLTQATLHQAMSYAKMLKPQHLTLTNGLQHFIFKSDPMVGTWHAIDHLPCFNS